MSTRHVKSPRLFFFSFFLSSFLSPFSCSTAPQAFSRPDRVLSRPARADAVKAGRSSAATPPGLRPLQQSSTTAGLMGRSINPVCHLSVFVSVRVIPITDVTFGRSCYEVHGACDVRINLYPAAPIRLAKVLLAWTIAQEGWDSSLGRQIGKCRFAMLSDSHTSGLPDTPDWGVGTQRTVDVIV
jgi:hypothetical protein